MTAEILATENVVHAASKIFIHNKKCNELSRATLPLVMTLSGLSILVSICGVLSVAAGEVVMQSPIARSGVAFLSFVWATLGLIPLSLLTKMHSASVYMVESLSLSGDPDAAAAAAELADDGDGVLSADEMMQLQIRQIFLTQAVNQQNAGNGSESAHTQKAEFASVLDSPADYLSFSAVGYRLGSIVVTTKFVQSIATTLYGLLFYVWQSSNDHGATILQMIGQLTADQEQRLTEMLFLMLANRSATEQLCDYSNLTLPAACNSTLGA